MPVDALLLLPLVGFSATILIHIGWMILFNALPKFTVTVVLEKVPYAVVNVAGLVVMAENALGLNPTA